MGRGREKKEKNLPFFKKEFRKMMEETRQLFEGEFLLLLSNDYIFPVSQFPTHSLKNIIRWLKFFVTLLRPLQ